jgi:NADH-quinone oxidoreductase subunit L
MGIPPLSGFWSKDAILASALAYGGALGWFLYLAGLAGALLTGMYALRLYLLVFHGEPSPEVGDHPAGHAEHGHGEGPLSMLLPVGILAVLAAVGGFLDIPGVIQAFGDWIDPVAEPLVHPTTSEDYATSVVAVIGALLGAATAWVMFKSGREIVGRASVRRVLEHKLYFDELYDTLFSRPAQALAVRLRDTVEGPVVQRSLVEVGRGTQEAAGEVARLQSGLLRAYAIAIAVSVVVLSVVFLAVR